jgi:hypothetical protein
MNFYDVLAAEKWGGGIPTTNFFDLLFAQSISGEQWQIYEGTLPATIISTGDDMRQYQIYGNTGGVGDDSGTAYGYEVDMATGSNILQSSEIEQGGWQAAAGSVPQKIVNPRRCRSKNIYPISGKKIFYDFKALNVNIAFIDSAGLSLGGAGFKSGAGSVDVLANAVKCLFIITNTDTDADITPTQVIAAGIWASVDATTTPIYIGDDPLEKVGDYADCVDYQKQKVVREIKKYVLKGDEEWITVGGTSTPLEKRYFRLPIAPLNYLSTTVNICSHFDKKDISNGNSIVGYRFYHTSAVNADTLNIRPENIADMSLSDFKSWLAEQYAAGTPVTVWCALTTPEEEDPPVTLPALPTCEGTTIVDYVGQSVAPEKVLLEYAKGGE